MECSKCGMSMIGVEGFFFCKKCDKGKFPSTIRLLVEREEGIVCSSCGAKATHSCGETGQFVCGSPLCDGCEHLIFPDGTNGGVGFMAQPLPDGVSKRHVKKADNRGREK